MLLCAWCVIIVWTLFSAGAGNRWLAWSFLRVNHLLRYIYCIRYFREWEQELNIRSVATSAQSQHPVSINFRSVSASGQTLKEKMIDVDT